MNILINSREFKQPGGVVSLYQKLSPHFRHSVQFFTMGARVHESGAWRSVRRLASDYQRFSSVLSTHRPDIVILNPSLAAASVARDGIFLNLAKRRGVKTLVFFHGWEHRFERKLNRRWCRAFRVLYDAADAFVVLAHEFRDRLRDFGFQQAIHLGKTAVEDELFAQNEFPKVTGSSNPFRVLFLARLVREKGIHETLKAFTMVRRRFPHAALSVVGNGPELTAARRHIQHSNTSSVTFHGHLKGSEKFNVVANSDCYVLPSYGEGLPLAVLEAMAHRLPVITCSVGGIADFFQSGRMGYLVPQRQPSAIADHICCLIQQPETRRQMGNFNRSYAQQHFAASRVARQLECFVEQLIEVNQKGGRRGFKQAA